MEFRKLRADEIELRVNQISEKGLSLLLYKDARVDMCLLDEAVGAENWQCKYSDHKGTLFCSVGIRINNEWIWKEDAGAPSNIESQKGEASDAFKRACVRWNIGRELYSSPFIWVPSGNYEAFKNDRGKWSTFDKFLVTSIGYNSKGEINELTIANAKTKRNVYVYGAQKPRKQPETKKAGNSASDSKNAVPDWARKITEDDWKELQAACKAAGEDTLDFIHDYGYEKGSEINVADYAAMIKELKGEQNE